MVAIFGDMHSQPIRKRSRTSSRHEKVVNIVYMNCARTRNSVIANLTGCLRYPTERDEQVAGKLPSDSLVTRTDLEKGANSFMFVILALKS